jgi:predicted RNA-binding Zn-ribbon protein involved in translation (DUF1610 family)
MIDNIDIAIKMKCEDCGHVQIVKGFRTYNGSRYFGSAYDFCDKCDGLPVLVEDLGDTE